MNAKAMFVTVFLVCCCHVAGAAPPTFYELQKIDDDPHNAEPPGFYVTDLNNRGEVIGGVEDLLNGPVRSFVWREGEIRDVNSPLGYSALLVAINDRSEIMGSYTDADGQVKTFIWHRGRSVAIDDADGFTAYDFNNRKQMIGADHDAEIGFHYFVWTRGQRALLEPLPDYPSMAFAPGGAINNRGAIVGSGYSAGMRVPAIWECGTVMPLQLPPNAGAGQGWDITDRGTVIANATLLRPNGTAYQGAYIWREGVITQLSSPSDLYEHVDARSINEQENVVGSSWSIGPAYGSIATVWYRSRAVDLNSRIADDDPLKPYVMLSSAHLINDHGRIVATGTDSRDSSGSTTYFLLTPRRGDYN